MNEPERRSRASIDARGRRVGSRVAAFRYRVKYMYNRVSLDSFTRINLRTVHTHQLFSYYSIKDNKTIKENNSELKVESCVPKLPEVYRVKHILAAVVCIESILKISKRTERRSA